MRVRYHSDSLEVCELHPLFAELLAELPRIAARHGKARARLYPDPFGGGASPEDLADWREHVEPGLERHFAGSRDVVASDLAAVAPAVPARCVIPGRNIGAWLNTLNQARFVVAEENGFGEDDLSGGEPPDLSTRRGLSLLKVHFYAHLQELLVEASGHARPR